MAKYHINPQTGNANICNAKVKCKFANSDGVEPPHYGTKQDAQKAAEHQLSSRLPTIPSLKNDVEIKEPVGDPRDPSQVKHDIEIMSKAVARLAKEHETRLREFQGELATYDNLPSEASSDEKRVILSEALHMTPALMESRKSLLQARTWLNEDHLVYQHKTEPDRAEKRRAVLESLNPKTYLGSQLHQAMSDALEDSEKELELSKRAIDNIRHRNAIEAGTDVPNMKSIWANVNDRQEQTHRMIQHARALQKLSELKDEYESVEAKNLTEKIHLAPLQSTAIERIAAESMTPTQVELESRTMAGMDRNMIDMKKVRELERQRDEYLAGDPMRDQINSSLRTTRADINRNRDLYFNSQSAIKQTHYKGFIKLSTQ